MFRAISNLAALRFGRTDVQNHVIDELLAGRLDRRSFLRHGSRVGLSMALMVAAMKTAGLSTIGSALAQSGTPGGTTCIR